MFKKMLTGRSRRGVTAVARSEGIVLTPGGEPLFARDLGRWREILAAPSERTPAQIAEDACLSGGAS